MPMTLVVDASSRTICSCLDAEDAQCIITKLEGPQLDLQPAARIASMVAASTNINVRMCIAITDACGLLIAFLRMPDAWPGSIDIAIKKARTAAYFKMPTGDIGQLSQPGGPLFGIEHSNEGLITFPGGIPVKNALGEVIGAVGVSGSTVENDHEVATAGAYVN